MGAVYRAEHRQLGTEVAIKVLHPRFGTDQDSVARFQREARIIASLRHANILSVYGFGSWQGLFYIAMEVIDGRPLTETIFEGEALSKPENKLPLLIQVCRAMTFAHKNGVLHRDLKPDNVLVVNNPDGTQSAKVVDFGLAKLQGEDELQQLTHTGEIFGDPNYMSPEQCQGKALDERSDIYSFGCLMYEVFSGVRPFESDTPLGTLYKHLQEPPRHFAKQAGISNALEEIVFRAMEKSRDRRYESFDEIAADLNRFINNPQMKASASIPPGRFAASRPGGNTGASATASDAERARWRKYALRALLILLLTLPAATATFILTRNDTGYSQHRAQSVFTNMSQTELRTHALETCSQTTLLIGHGRLPEAERSLAELDRLRPNLVNQPFVEALIDFHHGWYHLSIFRTLKVPNEAKEGVSYLKQSLQEYDRANKDASAGGGGASHQLRLDEITTRKCEAANMLRRLGEESGDGLVARQGALEVFRVVRGLPTPPNSEQFKALQSAYDFLIQASTNEGKYEHAAKLMWLKLLCLERQGCDPAFVASERKRLEELIKDHGGAKDLARLSPKLEAELRGKSGWRSDDAAVEDVEQ